MASVAVTCAIGLGLGWRECSSMVTKTFPIGVPIASFSDQPVIFWATGLRMVTRPSASVAMTASPMLLIVTRRRASLRSPVTRAACSRTSASSSSPAALTRLRSASSRSSNRRSRMAPASRRPLARSLNSVTRDVHGAIGSPRASARAARTAATCARTMRQRTSTAISSPTPAVSIPTVTSSCSDCKVGSLTADAGSPMAIIQPVRCERLHAENDGMPSRSVERTAPSSALVIALVKSGLGLPPTNFSSARVRATIVMRASMTATTPSTGAFC